MPSNFLVIVFSLCISIKISAATEIAHLKSGNTAYELEGSTDSPLVVMIHGVSGPMSVWDELYGPIVRSGFRVLRYDLYGRGNSERVQGPYDHDLFQNQLEELLQHLSLNHYKINFIASSMGNIIASDFIIRNRKQVETFTMIGPAGFPLARDFAQKLSLMPLVGDIATYLNGHKILLQRNKEYFYEPESFIEFLTHYEAQLRIKGSKRAILSTMRNMPVQNYLKGYTELATLEIPTLLVWGENDVSFPFKFSEDLLEIIPHAQFLPVPKAAHLPQLERPKLLIPQILDFLKTH